MKNADKSAFAVEGIYDSSIIGRGSATGFVINPQMGLTKREYFAAMALQGLSSYYYNAPEGAAKKAVQYADALLAELDKQQP